MSDNSASKITEKEDNVFNASEGRMGSVPLSPFVSLRPIKRVNRGSKFVTKTLIQQKKNYRGRSRATRHVHSLTQANTSQFSFKEALALLQF